MAQVGVKATLSLPVHDHATDPAGGKLSHLAVNDEFKLTYIDYVASDYLANSNDAEKANNNTTPQLFKEVKINLNPLRPYFQFYKSANNHIRVKFDLDSSDPSYLGFAQVYLNGIPKGTLRSMAGGYYTFSEDINFGILKDNDLIQLYAYSENTSANVKVRNFRLYLNTRVYFLVNLLNPAILVVWAGLYTVTTMTNTLT